MPRLICRPIDAWPETLRDPGRRVVPRFTAYWSDTLELLDREVSHLVDDDDTEIVLQLAVGERDLRNDGWIRATARPEHPGVVVSFESVHGPLRYSTDQFKDATVVRNWKERSVLIPGWQANVRAVALALEALRKVDRYGIGQGGEQYRGWQALPPGTPMPASKMTIEQAAQVLLNHDGGATPSRERLIKDPDAVRAAYRYASRLHHPDVGGDPDTFRRLTEARDLLLGVG